MRGCLVNPGDRKAFGAMAMDLGQSLWNILEVLETDCLRSFNPTSMHLAQMQEVLQCQARLKTGSRLG